MLVRLAALAYRIEMFSHNVVWKHLVDTGQTAPERLLYICLSRENTWNCFVVMNCYLNYDSYKFSNI